LPPDALAAQPAHRVNIAMEPARKKLCVAVLLPILSAVTAEEVDEDNCQIVQSAALLDKAESTSAVIAAGVASGLVNVASADSATVQDFVDSTVPAYSLDDFRAHFRMTRSTFQVPYSLDNMQSL